jgi:phage baseplate assembly protein W
MSYSLSSQYSQGFNPYKNTVEYERSPLATGYDINFTPEGDINTTVTGDFQLISGASLIETAILRLLYTSQYGYARWVRTSTGVNFIDSEYQNQAVNLVSAPNSTALKNIVQTTINQTLKTENRITVQSVELNTSNDANVISISVTYKIQSEATLRTLRANLNASVINSASVP